MRLEKFSSLRPAWPALGRTRGPGMNFFSASLVCLVILVVGTSFIIFGGKKEEDANGKKILEGPSPKNPVTKSRIEKGNTINRKDIQEDDKAKADRLFDKLKLYDIQSWFNDRQFLNEFPLHQHLVRHHEHFVLLSENATSTLSPLSMFSEHTIEIAAGSELISDKQRRLLIGFSEDDLKFQSPLCAYLFLQVLRYQNTNEDPFINLQQVYQYLSSCKSAPKMNSWKIKAGIDRTKTIRFDKEDAGLITDLKYIQHEDVREALEAIGDNFPIETAGSVLGMDLEDKKYLGKNVVGRSWYQLRKDIKAGQKGRLLKLIK